MKTLSKEDISGMTQGLGLEDYEPASLEQGGCSCPKPESITPGELKLFAGGAVLVVMFAVLGVWVKDFAVVAATQFGALVGAVCLKIKGNT